MRLFCQLGLHSWNRCKCVRCGLRRDTDHLWNGCKCQVCGKTRDEGHRWNGCKCTACGRTRDEGHLWKGCRCRVCGQTRDEGHDWDGCLCRRCGKVRDEGHETDLSPLTAQMRPAHRGTALETGKPLEIRCVRCKRLLRTLEKGKAYCPKCLHELSIRLTDWGGTSMKYEAVCPFCGYQDAYTVSDSW